MRDLRQQGRAGRARRAARTRNDPLRALGTNLLPVYIAVLKEKKSLPESFLIQANRVLPECLLKLIPRPADRGFRKYAVLRALPILNCDASPAMRYAFHLPRFSDDEEFDPRIPLEARRLFLTIRCRSVMELLIDELSSDDPFRRAEAAFLLIEYRQAATNAIPMLLKGLDKGEASAILALTAIDPDLPGLPERLVRIANSTDSDAFLRQSCGMALSALGPKAAGVATGVCHLLDISTDDSTIPEELKATYNNEKWRAFIITALGNMGRAATIAVPQLRSMLSDSKCSVRILAARAIWRITEDANLVVPVLKNILSSDNSRSTFALDWAQGIPDPLSQVNLTDATPTFFTTDELSCHEAAAYLLGEIGPKAKDAMPILEAASAGEGTTFQLLLCRARCRIRENNAEFIALLLNKLNSKVGLRPVCLPAAYFLSELGICAESAIPQLELLVKDEDPAIRAAAEHALIKIRHAGVEGGQH